MKSFPFALIVSIFATLSALASNHQAMLLRQQLHFESAGENFRAQTPGYTLEVSRDTIRAWVGRKPIEIRFIGSNVAKSLRGEEPQAAVVNRFVGADPSQWQTNLSTFGRIRMEQVYPGIDVVLYGNGLELEYDLELAPGVSPELVAIEFPGADSVTADKDGGLLLSVGEITLRQRAPIVYQSSHGERKIIPSKYSLDETGHAKFVIGAFDESQTLVIDPVLEWSTYLGATTDREKINDIAVDEAGNTYVTGTTYMYVSPDFPLKNAIRTPENFKDNNGQLVISTHAFITSFSRTGQLRFSTYFGGYHDDEGHGIAIGTNSAAGIYVTGWTRSMNPFVFESFPVTPGAYATNMLVSGQGVFLAKFTLDGGLKYSTLLFKRSTGGSIARKVAVDASGRAYIVGEVFGESLPGPTGSAADGAFVASLNAAGSQLLYANSVGNRDLALDVAVEPDGTAHVVGDIFDHFFGTPDAFDGTQVPLGVHPRGFLKKYSPTGTLLYSSRVGAGAALSVAVAPDGSSVYVGGVSSSSLGYFVVTNGFQMTFGGGDGDAYIARLDTRVAGKAGLKMQSYLGGSGSEGARAVALDAEGNILVTGATSSTNFPLAGAVQSNLVGGNSDAFATKINAAATGIIFSSYLGGSNDEASVGVAPIPGSRSFVVAGNTTSTNFPIRAAFQSTLKGTNGFIARISTSPPQDTLTVNSANDLDDGACDTAHCSLREAINSANQRPGSQTVSFNIPGSAVPVIRPTTGLPIITETLDIDGSTQPGIKWIEIDGSNTFADGLVFNATLCTARRLAVYGFFGNGIVLKKKINAVMDCVIGMDHMAVQARGNAGHGILVEGTGTHLIGDFGGGRNIISANALDGIRIQGALDSGTLIMGNLIGTDVEDRQDLGNGLNGISILSGHAHLIGSPMGEPNYISGNGRNGIYIAGPVTSGHTISVNRIGIGPKGTPVPNEENGIEIQSSVGNVIGSRHVDHFNVITGNDKDGILIANGSNGTKIHGNFIGVKDAHGTGFPLNGNLHNGISIEGSFGTIIGGSTEILGYAPGNVISGNRQDGIYIDSASTETTIEGNVIGTDRVVGDLQLGNRYGVYDRGSSTLIGGTTRGQENLISANTFAGVYIEGSGAFVQGNAFDVDLARQNLNYVSNSTSIQMIWARDAVIGGELSFGTWPGDAPGNLIAGGIFTSAIVNSWIVGNNIGFTKDGLQPIGPGKINFHGFNSQVGTVRGPNEIAKSLVAGGERNIVRANRIGVARNGTRVSDGLARKVELIDLFDSLIGGRAEGEGNTIVGGGGGIFPSNSNGSRGRNHYFGNAIYDFFGTPIGQNTSVNDRVTRPTVEFIGPSLLGQGAAAVVRFDPIPVGESAEVEVFEVIADFLGDVEVGRVLARAMIPRDGTRSSVIVHLRNVFNGYKIAATISQRGFSTSRFSLAAEYASDFVDTDFDGVVDPLEMYGPILDGNKDGIPDFEQTNIRKVPTGLGDGFITVEAKGDGSLNYIAIRPDLPPPQIAGKALEPSLGHGFTIGGTRPLDGAQVRIFEVEIFLSPEIQANAWLMYGVTADNAELHWFEFPWDGTSGVQFLSDRVVIRVIDDGRGDDDFVYNRMEFTGTFVQFGTVPFRIEEFTKIAGNEILLRYSAPSGMHRIEESANLSTWTSILTNAPTTPDPFVILAPSDAVARFFRLSSAP